MYAGAVPVAAKPEIAVSYLPKIVSALKVCIRIPRNPRSDASLPVECHRNKLP